MACYLTDIRLQVSDIVIGIDIVVVFVVVIVVVVCDVAERKKALLFDRNFKNHIVK